MPKFYVKLQSMRTYHGQIESETEEEALKIAEKMDQSCDELDSFFECRVPLHLVTFCLDDKNTVIDDVFEKMS